LKGNDDIITKGLNGNDFLVVLSEFIEKYLENYARQLLYLRI